MQGPQELVVHRVALPTPLVGVPSQILTPMMSHMSMDLSMADATSSLHHLHHQSLILLYLYLTDQTVYILMICLVLTHLQMTGEPPPLGQLEGPGMPVARNTHTGLSISSATVLTPSLPLVSPSETQAGNAAGDTATEVGEGDGEGDDRTYCFCEGISYGEMIACDDVNCEREWVRYIFLCPGTVYSSTLQFHLACIGLTVPPDGTWFCDACRQKKNAKRGSRANKKRSGGGGGSTRSGGKAANNG
jgi:hypothetical protein